MSRDTWRASGRPRESAAPRARGARPEGSWGVALDRARRSWDGLRGGPPADGVYSEAAAAAILATALGLWGDVAAGLASAE
jgi:hypothetical protein